MDELDLDAIEKRCEAATEGPWYSHEGDITCGRLKHGVGERRIGRFDASEHEGMFCSEDVRNAHFTSYARTDVPALVERVRELAGGLEQSEHLEGHWRSQARDAIRGHNEILKELNAAKERVRELEAAVTNAGCHCEARHACVCKL